MFFSMQPDIIYPPPADRDYLLTLDFVPPSVVGAPAVGYVWDVPATGFLTIELPTFRTKDGLEGYRFSFEVTEVAPEPATLGMLILSMLPLWRRHRRRR